MTMDEPDSHMRQEAEPQADFRWLWRFMMVHKRATIASLFWGIVAGASAAAQPYLIGVIIDHVKEGASIQQLTTDGLTIIGLALFTVHAFFWMRHFSGQVAFSVNYDMREALFDNLLTLEQSFFHHYQTGDIIARMNSDVDITRRLLLLGLTSGGAAFFTLTGTIILLATINVQLTLIVFVVLGISTYFQLRAGKVLAPVFEKVQDQGGTLSALVQDAISGIQTIKTSGSEKGVARKYAEENREYRRRWLYFKRRNEPVGMLPQMISELTAGIVLIAGGVFTIQGMMSIGNFAQFLIYLAVIGQALLHIGTTYQRYQHVRGAFQRLTPLLKTAEIRNKPNPLILKRPRGEISYKNVGVKFDDEWLLRDINVDIPAGSVVGLVGATGSGKSLMVSLLARVLDPSQGTVTFDGTDVRDIDLDTLRQASAYVPQATFLFSQRLDENVRMGQPGIHEDEMDRAIRISRVSNDLQQLPDGMETMVGEQGVMLSGGQKQRVAIARAIVRDPAILILDDALSSVDTHTAADILGELRDVLRSRTSIIIAHRISTVKDADFILVMDEGQLVEQGTHDELVALDGFYARMVERELKTEDMVYDHA